MDDRPSFSTGLVVAVAMVVLLAVSARRPAVVPGPPCPATGVAADRLVMLSTSWCPYCRSARAYLSDRGIDFCEYDIETSDRGAALYAGSGAAGVPVFLRRGEAMHGFSQARLQRFLAATRAPR